FRPSVLRRRVQRVEPDIGIVQRRRAAAHPGVGVAFAVLAHPASAATAATAAASALAVGIIVAGEGGIVVGAGLVLAASAAATATTATTAATFGFVLIGPRVGFVLGRLVERADVAFVFILVFVLRFVLEGGIVE